MMASKKHPHTSNVTHGALQHNDAGGGAMHPERLRCEKGAIMDTPGLSHFTILLEGRFPLTFPLRLPSWPSS
ncbi:hypothetical protein CKO25_14770 [Thiocapsa imhoffii]|uniref:Uncharacterized protein n=1 Tax=Thiocapsa imhoffii TaxID=382777 RepID=A0A9X1B9I2_9GAMM|nr:hypothetical protein [Thiocapsa imhoffii]